MPAWTPWLLVPVAYLVGSISFATVIAHRYGIEIRVEGSGNPGATNVRRVVGPRAGRVVLLFDALKGFGPCLVAREWVGEDTLLANLTALAAILGHIAPVWHRFHGGKGVATAAGTLLAIVPPAGGAALGVYVVLRKATGYASVGALSGAAAGTIVTSIWVGVRAWPTAMTLITFGILVLRHRSNLRRLREGEELAP